MNKFPAFLLAALILASTGSTSLQAQALPRAGSPGATEVTNRCTEQGRLTKLKENGGTPECEKAVVRALDYLRTNQNEDGSWGTTFKGAYTGIALLAFLGHCETSDSLLYGENVTKAVLFLIELAKKNNGLIGKDAQSGIYEHGVASCALGEAYAAAKLSNKTIPGLREAFESSVKLIIEGRNINNDWSRFSGQYYLIFGKTEDPLGMGWRYQALKSAKSSGLAFTGLDQAMVKIVKYIKGEVARSGGIGGPNLEQAFNQWTMTPIAVYGLQTFPVTGSDTTINHATRFYLDFLQHEPVSYKENNPYVWYFASMMFFRRGGQEWMTWNKNVLPLILLNQAPDGGWSRGGLGKFDSSIYPTAIYALMLEVYYGDSKQGKSGIAR